MKNAINRLQPFFCETKRFLKYFFKIDDFQKWFCKYIFVFQRTLLWSNGLYLKCSSSSKAMVGNFETVYPIGVEANNALV